MPDPNTSEKAQSIDYGGKQADIDKAKQAAHDADSKRLASEHPDHPDYEQS
jgi:hypothetical protein